MPLRCVLLFAMVFSVGVCCAAEAPPRTFSEAIQREQLHVDLPSESLKVIFSGAMQRLSENCKVARTPRDIHQLVHVFNAWVDRATERHYNEILQVVELRGPLSANGLRQFMGKLLEQEVIYSAREEW